MLTRNSGHRPVRLPVVYKLTLVAARERGTVVLAERLGEEGRRHRASTLLTLLRMARFGAAFGAGGLMSAWAKCA